MTVQSDADRFHQVQGVTVTPLDGRAHVDDTGLEVFEIVRVSKRVNQRFERLAEVYHWLTPAQLQAALAFYRYNRGMVDARLEAEYRARIEDAWSRQPASKPSYR